MSTETRTITPITPEQLENATRMAAKVVEVFGDDWTLHYDPDGDEVSCRTDHDTPFEGAYVEVFSTSQWPSGQDSSPVAEFLRASIVMVPRLIGEVERRKAELKVAFGPGLYLDIQKVLDKALGTEEADGAGAGIVADITLVAGRMQAAEAEVERLRADLKEAEGKLHAIAQARVWKNEDGRGFVFADDLRLAVGLPGVDQ